jgi:hypothetical protein
VPKVKSRATALIAELHAGLDSIASTRPDDPAIDKWRTKSETILRNVFCSIDLILRITVLRANIMSA